MENRLQLLQQQKLTLTPELKQALAILQLPLLDLENYLTQQLEENPVLELDLGDKEEVSLEETQMEQNTEDWLEYFNQPYANEKAPNSQREPTQIEQPQDFSPTLHELLHEQAVLVFSLKDMKLAQYIIENIDTKGYLHLNEAEAIVSLKTTAEKFDAVLKLIQQFEPVGVASRSIEECLSVQIMQEGLSPEVEGILLRLVQEHLQDMATGKVARLGQIFSISTQEMQGYLDLIKKFNPYPGSIYDKGATVYILPDVVVEKVSGEFIVLVNDSFLPRITMSATYLTMIKNSSDNDVRKYIQQKINTATWLLRSIEQRRLTIYKVANAILKLQYAFFEHGHGHLRPLILHQVADEIGMHESTVSRTVANKYMQTPHGLVSLKSFFSGRLATTGGEDASVTTIKEHIRLLISEEDSFSPFSDQKIAEILTSEGVNISRRTVAKYREELRILTSARRKRY